jgi:hypothetical protein
MSQNFRDFLEEYAEKEELPGSIDQKTTKGDFIFKDLPGAKIPVHDPKDRRPYATRLREAVEEAAQGWLDNSSEQLTEFIKTRLSSQAYLREAASWAKPVGVKVFDLNHIRAAALQQQKDTITDQLEPLLAIRRRVTGRPRNPQSQASRDATLLVLDGRINSLRHHAQQLQDHIQAYLELAEAEDSERVTF